MWKLSCVLAFVCCVLVFALVMLKQQNKFLQEQNSTLTRQAEVSLEAVKAKQKRLDDELQRLVTLYKAVKSTDASWRNMVLPDDVSELMQQYLDSNPSTISVAPTAKGCL